jgi:sterol desaturase/sphingolipid hydroxylase (fatty acid hydroxylase superfamily)
MITLFHATAHFFHAAAHFFFPKVALVTLVLLGIRLVVLTGLEKRAPAHFVRYEDALPRDVLAALIMMFGIIPATNFFNLWFSYQPVLPQWILAWPLTIRLILYVVLADFGAYWVHRLVHTRHLWRAHKWHHYPTRMYWLAGARASCIEMIMQNLPYIAAGALLVVSPWWIYWALVLKATLTNDFMHLNIWWGNRWLEWIIVTPRYHHIHHSADPEHYNNNLAVLFPIWDHLFGTYLDPEKVSKNLTFGIGESVPAVRLIIGV